MSEATAPKETKIERLARLLAEAQAQEEAVKQAAAERKLTTVERLLESIQRSTNAIAASTDKRAKEIERLSVLTTDVHEYISPDLATRIDEVFEAAGYATLEDELVTIGIEETEEA